MTQAIILAAGQGTRLRPITNDKPKCLTPIDGKTLLERQSGVLQAAGVTDITVIGGYRIDQIKALGYQCKENSAFESTNMVSTLFCAESVMNADEDLLICYGDIIYQPENLTKVLETDGEVVLMVDKAWRKLWELRLENPLEDAETLKLTDSKDVLELGKKPKSYDEIQGQYTGLIKIRKDKVKDFIAFYHALDKSVTFDGQDFDNMYMTSFIQQLIDANWEVKAALVHNGWLEIDSVSDLEAYQSLQDQGLLKPFCDLG
ncbi:NTP transferase domain-containing protein [Marinicella rhabdoformis]|uniref:phosphocholine cytidylyltransferase family protein n=1 Tax=Marinicella rhabdoformis TaxID=2580566 RepID=UPI0012AEC748|nr:phosphocholine cytidylyltransferase family protein [Marinicella rhabdoformis]